LEHSNSHHIFKNSKGFTLIEVLIAITILSFISFSTYKMIDSNTETKDRVIKEDRITVQGLTAIGRLDADFSQIVNPLFAYGKYVPTTSNLDNAYVDTSSTINGSFIGKTINGANIPQFKSEEKSSLVFLSQANRRKFADSKESRYAWIKYSLKPMELDPEESKEQTSGLYEFVRQSISTDIYNNNIEWTKPKPQIIMEKVKEVEFSFWDEKTKKYTTSLQELNENKDLIRSIKLSLTWIDDNDHEQKVVKTFRVLHPYFNTKLDDFKTNAAIQDGGFGTQVPPADGQVNPDPSGAVN
jgi:prepilin-type N-terminal cleavage/methylation domain-containing protein